ncbi:hypothetical protein evm_010716 [Chilo suppressalis]|nr:hypothetical protein evm_010716 [Chilo suppressalis]
MATQVGVGFAWWIYLLMAWVYLLFLSTPSKPSFLQRIDFSKTLKQCYQVFKELGLSSICSLPGFLVKKSKQKAEYTRGHSSTTSCVLLKAK